MLGLAFDAREPLPRPHVVEGRPPQARPRTCYTAGDMSCFLSISLYGDADLLLPLDFALVLPGLPGPGTARQLAVGLFAFALEFGLPVGVVDVGIGIPANAFDFDFGLPFPVAFAFGLPATASFAFGLLDFGVELPPIVYPLLTLTFIGLLLAFTFALVELAFAIAFFFPKC